jgi:hypothetical protein
MGIGPKELLIALLVVLTVVSVRMIRAAAKRL